MRAATENHLRGRTAAYLVQHVDDPVDWYPWDAEAFERARSLGRPVFLCVGYASCHWCHLMQRESFRDPETAAFLNERFVPVLVDREEHPEVDHLYQQYLVLATGTSGGWPLNVVLTPDGAPFYGGTYFPKRGSYAMQSLAAVLTGAQRTFRDDRAQVDEAARNALTVLADLQEPKSAKALDADDLRVIAGGILDLEDRERGGLGAAPKSPQWPTLEFLLAQYEAASDERCLAAARRWLEAMLRGGLYDHAGGGVFRYTEDEAWTLPHFEKMLPDNAMLLSILARMHRLAPSEELEAAAHGTARFLARDLARPGGGWWSSLDAEAGGIEGGSYLWRYEELQQVLSAEELALAERHLGVTPEGNRRGSVHLTRRGGRAEDAEAVDAVLGKLWETRRGRPQPRAIENAPADWNALAARGLIEAGLAFCDDALVREGLATLELLLAGPLTHLLGSADARVPLLSDHAHLAAACVTAPAATGPSGERLLASAIELFEADGVLRMTSAGSLLPVRAVAYDDVPIPSGMSTLLEVHRALRPGEEAEFHRLSTPLRAFVRHSPVAAGHALAIAADVAREGKMF